MQKLFHRGSKKSGTGTEEARAVLTSRLHQVPIFQGLSPEEVETLFQGVMLRECAAGTVFFSPDDSSERLFILKEGHVDLYRLTLGGKRLVTRHLGPGTIFGEMGLLGQSLQGCFAEATANSLVCVATRDDILRVFNEHPDMIVRLLETLGNRLRVLEERLEQAAFSPVRVRLAHFLMSNMDAAGKVSGYTHAEIGDTIGALRQTVTETLSEMQNKGLLEVGHKQIRVTNVPGVGKIALEEEASH